MDSLLVYIVAILAVIFYILILRIKRSFSYWKRRNVPYVEPRIPFGNYGNPITNRKPQFFYLQLCYDHFKKMGAKFGGFYAYTAPMFLPIDPEYVKCVLVKDFQSFHDRGFYQSEHQPIGMNLFNTDGEKWNALRAKFTPTFTPAKLRNMFQLIVNAAETMDKHVENHAIKKIPLNIKDCATRFACNIIGSYALGIECNSYQDNTLIKLLREIVVGSGSFLRISFCMALPKVANFLRIAVFLPKQSEMVCRSLEATIKYRMENDVSRNDFLQLLIDMKNDGIIDINELKAQCLLFLLAGFETSSTTINFVLFELAMNGDVQEKLRREIKDTLFKYDGKITYEAIADMKYLEMVVCETLRKYPPGPFLMRKCVKDYKLPDTNVIIEKDTIVTVPVIALHYDPEYFPNPDWFDPERFSDENKEKIKPFTYMPFGDGPRSCIGDRLGKQEVKVGIVSLLRKYKFALHPTVKLPLEFDTSFAISAKIDILLDVEL